MGPAVAPSIPIDCRHHSRVRQILLEVRQRPNSGFVIWTKWSPIEVIDPVGDLENDKIILPFAVHDWHDVSVAANPSTQDAIPRFIGVKFLVY